jgi:hypothetical protein
MITTVATNKSSFIKNTDLRGNAKRERPYTESKQRKRFSKLDGYAKVNRSKEKMMGEECSQLQTLARVHNASGLQ